MARKKFGIEFEGFDELFSKLDELNGDLKKVTEQALIETHKAITPNLHRDMIKHRRTGRTEESIIDTAKVEWQGMTAGIDVGFDISNGGLASIFLMYGTPRMAKDTKLFNDIYGSRIKKEVGEIQREIILGAIENLGG